MYTVQRKSEIEVRSERCRASGPGIAYTCRQCGRSSAARALCGLETGFFLCFHLIISKNEFNRQMTKFGSDWQRSEAEDE